MLSSELSLNPLKLEILSLISECKIMAKNLLFKDIFPNLTGIFPYASVGKIHECKKNTIFCVR